MLPNNLSRIIEYLFRNIPNRFNVNQIARGLKISVGSAYKILKLLNQKGILISQNIGNGIYYTLNLVNEQTKSMVKLVLIENKNKFLEKTPQAAIYAKDLKEAEKFCKSVILFGSILERKDAKDVDVLFIVTKGKTKKIEDFCLALSNSRPKRISPLIMTAADFRKNIARKDMIVTGVLRRGMIVFGEDTITRILGNM